MRIGIFNFFHGHPEYGATVHLVLGDMMLRSVRKVMPDVEIVQLTDENSPQLIGTDSVIRRAHPHFAMLRVEHYIACEGDWVFLDTDMLIQRDIRHVFDDEFDIAIADRVGCVTPDEGVDYPLYQKMPHNSGVVFSRSPEFWKAVLYHMQNIPPARKEWLGDQYAVNDVIATGKFNVKVLPGRIYNCPPLDVDDRCEDAAIVHFKGPIRKKMMLERFAEV